MASHRRNPAELPIPRKNLKLYCPNHGSLQDVKFITKRDGVDVAVLTCNCARTRHLATDKISLEHVGTPEGAAFQADMKLVTTDEQYVKYRQEWAS